MLDNNTRPEDEAPLDAEATTGGEPADVAGTEPERAAATDAVVEPGPPAAPEAAADPFATSELDAIEESLSDEPPVEAGAAAGEPAEEPVGGHTPTQEEVEAAFAEQATTVLPPSAAEAAAAQASVPILDQAVSEVDLGPERRSGIWVWLGLIAGMLVAAGAIGYAWWYTTERPVPVPAVVGKQSPQAVQLINDSGLRLGRITEEPTDAASVGSVISQEPKSASKLKPGDLVSLVVAAEPKMTEVPEVTGRTSDEALTALASASLSAHILESYASTVPAGFVISQVPTAGAELRPGTLIAMAVSKGPAPGSVRMPKLIGLKQTDAEALLGANKLRGSVYHSYNASITVGEIYAQSPLAETSVAYDTVAQYLVSDGAGTTSVVVPATVGTTRKVAESRIKAKGLKPQVKQTPHLSVPKGQVISSMPQANTKVARGATVGLLVSRGSTNETSVPNFVGLASQEASSQANAAGFKPTIIEVPIAGPMPGTVFGQWPSPATIWHRRFGVMIVVARAQ